MSSSMQSDPLLNLLSSFAQTQVVCTTFASCCADCGPHSVRCARGPPSRAGWSRNFFSFSRPLENVGFWDVVFSFYGMVPYLAVIVALAALLVSWAIKRDRSVLKWSVRLLVLGYVVISTVVRAVIVKSLGDCKHCFRPCGSAVGVHGLPSGHSMSSIGLCSWLLLETWFGSRTLQWPRQRQIVVSLLLVLVFVPVPYSRVYLGDHTGLQVIVGSAIGLVLGVGYFFLLRRFVLVAKLRDQSIVCHDNESDNAALQVTLVDTNSEPSPKYEAGAVSSQHHYSQHQSPVAAAAASTMSSSERTTTQTVSVKVVPEEPRTMSS